MSKSPFWSTRMSAEVATCMKKIFPGCNKYKRRFSQVSSFNINEDVFTKKLHQKVLFGKEPHECKDCEKRFRNLDLFRSHQPIHSGEKLINLNFVRKDSLV